MSLSHNDLAIMDNLIGTIVNSDAWDQEQLQNPEIQTAEKALEKELDQIRGLVSDKVIGRIEDAAFGYSNAFSTAAILYGIRVANIIRDVSACPSDLSQFILDRIDRQKGGQAGE